MLLRVSPSSLSKMAAPSSRRPLWWYSFVTQSLMLAMRCAVSCARAKSTYLQHTCSMHAHNVHHLLLMAHNLMLAMRCAVSWARAKSTYLQLSCSMHGGHQVQAFLLAHMFNSHPGCVRRVQSAVAVWLELQHIADQQANVAPAGCCHELELRARTCPHSKLQRPNGWGYG